MIKFITKNIAVVTITIIVISLSFQWFRSWKKQKISDLTDTIYAKAGEAVAKRL